jgi:hypothetical protein
MKSRNFLLLSTLILSCHTIQAKKLELDLQPLEKVGEAAHKIEFKKAKIAIKKQAAQCRINPIKYKKDCADYTAYFCKHLPKNKSYMKFVKEINTSPNCTKAFEETVANLKGPQKSNFASCKIKASNVCRR